MGKSSYGCCICSFCRKLVKRCGFSMTSHGRMHVRKGECVEIQQKDRYYGGYEYVAVSYVPDKYHKFSEYQKGQFKITKQCDSVIFHGPGHQSRTKCVLKGKHDVHEATYGLDRMFAQWRGKSICTDYFDNPRPCKE